MVEAKQENKIIPLFFIIGRRLFFIIISLYIVLVLKFEWNDFHVKGFFCSIDFNRNFDFVSNKDLRFVYYYQSYK